MNWSHYSEDPLQRQREIRDQTSRLESNFKNRQDLEYRAQQCRRFLDIIDAAIAAKVNPRTTEQKLRLQIGKEKRKALFAELQEIKSAIKQGDDKMIEYYSVL